MVNFILGYLIGVVTGPLFIMLVKKYYPIIKEKLQGANK